MKSPGLTSIKTLLPRLSIRAKLLIAFVGLSVLPVLCVSIYAVLVNLKTMERIALGDLTRDVGAIRSRTANYLASVEGDILLLKNSTHLEDVLQGKSRTRSMSETASEFEAFAKTKGIYYQLRLIDNDGDELMRVETDPPGDLSSSVRIVPSSELRRGNETFYALLTQNLRIGAIAFSPAELMYGEGKRVPVISFATPLPGLNGRAGILIANVFARSLFNVLEVRHTPGLDEKVVLVGNNGYYLYDSNVRDNWNRLLASREEENLQKDYTKDVADAILSGNEGILTAGDGEIIAYAPLLPVSPEGRLAPELDATLSVFETVPRASIVKEAQSSALALGGFLLLFFGAAISLGLLATRQFTRPIAELQEGAGVISRGNYRHRLAVETGDEIELLAHQFNRMAGSLEEHEREILQHRSRLEETVISRTRELIDEKGKLQAILDNVPSAFVMLDHEWRIQSVSAAFSTITGLTHKDVIGKNSRELFRHTGLCQASNGTAGVRLGGIETHVDRVPDAAGAARFLEHTSISIPREDGVASILQIITDVTKRKKLEEHLIHSEKLMATGEMAAIIAHGFRNSLTSIKMILQLQRESKKLGTAGRRSLQVALDSISRMENVVQDLLNFARPSPLQFGMHDLNTLVDQSLSLVAPRLKSHNVTIKKRLDQHLPLIHLDATRFREAMVNLLVNALQAFEGDHAPARPPAISVTTSRLVLQKTLRDFYPPSEALEEDGRRTDTGREVVLRKGRECVVITITDSGPGIDRETLNRVFDPFFTTKTNGTGLGLPMVKRTVLAHGGIVSLRSSNGRGTIVEIVLPLHSAAASLQAGSPDTWKDLREN